ncbi:MAG: CHRD domain-containing protein [Pseudomonadota bacterium]
MITKPSRRSWIHIGAALALVVAAGSSYSNVALAGDVKVALTGSQEVPANTSAATGTGTITVSDDMSVHGSVTTKGITGTMAHIHVAAAGANGPVAIALEKNGDTYSVPANAKLTHEQFESFKAGNLYVNVHSAEHPGGELRAQLKP